MKKIIIIGTLAVALAAASVFPAVEEKGSSQKLKTTIEEACSAFLQRPLTLETLDRRPFPNLDIYATGLKVMDTDGQPIIECPQAVIKVSAFSLLWLTLSLDEIRFINPKVYYRGQRNGESNIRDVVRGLKKSDPAKKKSRISLAYRRIAIENGTLEATDRETGHVLLPSRLIVNGAGDIKKTFKQRRFIFEAAGKFESLPSADLGLRGVLSRSSVITAVVRNLKASFLAEYAPSFHSCEGTFDLDLWWKKIKGRSVWRAEFNPKDVCPDEPVVFPAAALEYTGVPNPPRLTGLLKSQNSKVEVEVLYPREHPGFSSVSVRSPAVDVMEMFQWEQAIKRVLELKVRREPQTPSRAWKTVVHVDVSTAIIKNEKFHNLWCEIERSSAAVTTIQLSSATAFGGFLQGRIDIEASTVALTLRGLDLRAERIFSLFTASSSLEGLSTVDAHVTSRIGPEFIRGVEGNITVALKEGSLPKTPAILNILTSANVHSLASHLEGKKGARGVPVDKGYARIRIKNGKAIAEADDPWILENELMQAAFIGEVDYVAEQIDGNVVLQVLTLPDELVNLVPGLRFILFGRQKSFFPIYMRIDGPFSNPMVKVQGIKTVTGPLWNTLGRILRLPKDAVDKMRGN